MADVEGPDYSHVVYVPPFTVDFKQGFDMNVVLPLIESGKVTLYQAAPRYEGDSFVPSAIDIEASEPGGVQMTLEIWGEALAEE